MKYLVDANILSEPSRSAPNPRVLAWLRDHERDIAVDPIIIGEIRFGIYLLPAGSRQRRLEKWFVHGIEKLRCLPWQAAIGIRWAKLLAQLRDAGESMPIKDSIIAATALHHDLTLATHNTRDFKKSRVKIIDPWTI